MVETARDNNIHEVAIPVGMLSLAGMKGCEELTSKVDKYLVEWRSQRHGELMDDADFIGTAAKATRLRPTVPVLEPERPREP